jgi:NAD(P)-dependent dehydrogenase (short-subunit alcohol dehydrogenase family)
MKQERWGRIINVRSLAAKTGGLTAGTAYAVSKGALSTLTLSLARELAGHGVTVTGPDINLDFPEAQVGCEALEAVRWLWTAV